MRLSRRGWRGGAVRTTALAMGLVLLAACDSLLTVDNPGRVPSDALDDPALMPTLEAAALQQFQCAYAQYVGTAGMLSLLTARSGALIGVLISVTTIPAAANIGVAAAYRNWGEFRGAALQLAINLGALVLAGIATLLVERAAFRRRRGKPVRTAPGPAPPA